MIENAIVVANIYTGGLYPTTCGWLCENFPEDSRIAFKKEVPMLMGRNSMIRDAAIPRYEELKANGRNIEWLWFIDNDVTITHPGLERWMETPGDVVSCQGRMESGDIAWSTESAFHNHFWRCRPEVLYEITPPWFELIVSKDGCDVYSCECQFFAIRAQEAGFEVRYGGSCGHDAKGSWRRMHPGSVVEEEKIA